jgi:hypothetical protein
MVGAQDLPDRLASSAAMCPKRQETTQDQAKVSTFSPESLESPGAHGSSFTEHGPLLLTTVVPLSLAFS